MTDHPRKSDIRIRVVFGPGEMIGPGKAELLEHIEKTGSIAGAGREMGMSYKRAWQLVEAMNAMFREPVVLSTRGGAKGGGATVTPTGKAVLAEYRGLVDESRRAGQAYVERIGAMMRDISDGK